MTNQASRRSARLALVLIAALAALPASAWAQGTTTTTPPAGTTTAPSTPAPTDPTAPADDPSLPPEDELGAQGDLAGDAPAGGVDTGAGGTAATYDRGEDSTLVVGLLVALMLGGAGMGVLALRSRASG